MAQELLCHAMQENWRKCGSKFAQSNIELSYVISTCYMLLFKVLSKENISFTLIIWHFLLSKMALIGIALPYNSII